MMEPRPLCSLILAAAMLAAWAVRDGSPPVSYDPVAQRPTRQTSIAGHVIISDGSSPIGVTVVLRRLGEDLRSSGYQRIGPDGKFSFDSLASGAYTLLAYNETSQDVQVDLGDDGSPALHRPGDIVELLIEREQPGVITGTVTSQSGEPLVEAIVQAILVRDDRGNPTNPVILAAVNLQRRTDDRGVYRLWGLRPGSYLISAGGKSRGRSILTAYDSDAPAYYTDPSSGSPRPVAVSPGQEVTGIDIQYRGGSGHKVIGVFSGSDHHNAQRPQQSNQEARRLVAVLTDTLTGEQKIAGIDMPGAPPGLFEFSELPDSEYEISVVLFGGAGGRSEAASDKRRITVKGADVTGIQLKAVSLGTISGRIAVEPAPDPKPGCARKEAPKLDQAALNFSRTGQPHPPSPWNQFSPSSSIDVGIDNNGNFPPTRLEPGAYRIKTYFADDTFYVDSIMLGGPGKPSRIGPLFSIKEGQQISPAIITLGRGAARLSGHVVAPAGTPLPAALEVYLVPATAEHADDPLRFSMARVSPSGRFVLANIPPDRYRIFVRPAAKDSDRPDIGTTEGRASLRREAERAGITLDLASCQRLEDFAITYGRR